MTLPPYLLRALILAGLTGVTGLALAWASDSTRERIAQNALEDLRKQLSAVVPPARTDAPLDQEKRSLRLRGSEIEFYIGRQDGQVSAIAFETESGGYSGPIRILLGVSPEGTLLGVRILSHTETPGLGDRIEVEKSDWVRGFEGKSLGQPPLARWKVKPDGGDFDAFSGATITPRAVVKGVREGLERFGEARSSLIAGSSAPEGAASGRAAAKKAPIAADTAKKEE